LAARIYDLTGSFNYALISFSAALLGTTLLVIGVRAKEKQVLTASN
jgi:hypothetical protein